MRKRLSPAEKTILREETLNPLGTLDLQRVTGGTRVRIPIGYTPDGEPIYADDDGGG